MKALLAALAVSFVSTSALAAEIKCFWDNQPQACNTAYDIFVSDSACFAGEATEAATLFGTSISDDADLKYLEIQVTNNNRILVWVSDMGTERLIRINKCAE